VDYDNFELVCFWVLAVAPALLLVTIGIAAHRKWATRWQPKYLVLGISCCIFYALFGGRLIAWPIMSIVPPPYVPGLSEGRGLDLRGIGFFIGPWIGAIASTIAALITACTSQVLILLRSRRALAGGVGGQAVDPA
jgi:hypothetical protein